MPNVHEELNDADLWVLFWFWYTENTPLIFRD